MKRIFRAARNIFLLMISTFFVIPNMMYQMWDDEKLKDFMTGKWSMFGDD